MTILAVIHALSFLEADHEVFVSWFIKGIGINKLESNRCDDKLCEDIWFWQDINPNGYDK